MSGWPTSTRNRVLSVFSGVTLIVGLIGEATDSDVGAVGFLGYRWNLWLVGTFAAVVVGLALEAHERGKRVTALELELAKIVDDRERRREIRYELGELMQEADYILETIQQRLSLIDDSPYPTVRPPRVDDLGEGQAYSEWLADVRRFLAVRPELGEGAVAIFDDLDGLPRLRNDRVTTEANLRQIAASIPIRKARLKEFMDEFKG